MQINLVLDGGWPPSELETMKFQDFLGWYNQAILVHEAREKAHNRS